MAISMTQLHFLNSSSADVLSPSSPLFIRHPRPSLSPSISRALRSSTRSSPPITAAAGLDGSTGSRSAPRSVTAKSGSSASPNFSSMSAAIMSTELDQRDHQQQGRGDSAEEEEEGEVLEAWGSCRKRQQQPETELPLRWRQMAGEDGWRGLLDPMDPLLRHELVRYGEMAQACYDAFDFDSFSKYCGSCKHNRRHFFDSLALPNYGSYEVTRHLYATSNIRLPNFLKRSRYPRVWSESANWIGYVAVSGDDSAARLGRRDIVVAWRGTVTRLEWLADLTDFLKPVASEGIPCPDPAVKVESGFVDLYTDKDPHCRFCKYSARQQVLAEVSKLVKLHTGRGEEVSITVTGHSLGSALAMLSAFDIAETEINVGADGVAAPICVYSFSGPRVGNVRFKERFEEELNIKALRVVNVHDSVPKVPGVLFNEQVHPAIGKLAERVVPWWCYTHVGVELQLDHTMSPFLKETGDPSCFHNLEAHLHLLDGYHGKGERFVLASGRDPALVNKACDFLKDHHLVPPFWRQPENKGMVRREGRWMQPDRPRLDDHPEDMNHHLKHLGLHQ